MPVIPDHIAVILSGTGAPGQVIPGAEVRPVPAGRGGGIGPGVPGRTVLPVASGLAADRPIAARRRRADPAMRDDPETPHGPGTA